MASQFVSTSRVLGCVGLLILVLLSATAARRCSHSAPGGAPAGGVAAPAAASLADRPAASAFRLVPVRTFGEPRASHDAEVVTVLPLAGGGKLASGDLKGSVAISAVAGGDVVRWKPHDQAVMALAATPDGALVASGGRDGLIGLTDASLARSAGSFRAHQSSIRALAFLDRTTLLSCGVDGSVRWWGIPGGTAMREVAVGAFDKILLLSGLHAIIARPGGVLERWDLSAPTRLSSWKAHARSAFVVAVDELSQTVLSADSQGPLSIRDASNTLREGPGFEGSFITSVTISPEGDRFAAGSGHGRVMIGELRAGQARVLRSWNAHRGWVRDVRFGRGGTVLFTGGDDKCARAWNAATGALVPRTGHARPVWSVAFDPDGRTALSGSDDGEVRSWIVASGQQTAAWNAHAGTVWCIEVSPDGTRAVTSSEDHGVSIWRLPSGEPVATFRDHADAVCSARFDPKGGRIVTTGKDGRLVLRPAEAGPPVQDERVHTSYAWTAVFSPAGDRIASADLSGSLRLAFTGPPGGAIRKTVDTAIDALAYRPDGQALVAACGDGTVRLFDAAGEPKERWPAHSKRVLRACWARDGSAVVSVGDDGTLALWDARGTLLDRVALPTGHSGVPGLATHGASVLVGCGDATVRLFAITATPGAPR